MIKGEMIKGEMIKGEMIKGDDKREIIKGRLKGD
jgi:hypothetical protein